MVPALLSILLVVLMSGAVLWVVAGDRGKPTSARPIPGAPPVPAPPGTAPEVPPPPRRPATSRRRPPRVPEPAPLERLAVTPRAVERPGQTITARMGGAPLPRHRARSSVLLLLLVIVMGLLVAVLVGALVAALAFALRAAVTS